MAQTVKNLPAMQGTWVRFLGWGRSPGEGNGNPLQYPCLENSNDGVWQAPWDHTELNMTENLMFSLSLGYSFNVYPVFLPGESQGQESLVGCHLWGHTESDMTDAT